MNWPNNKDKELLDRLERNGVNFSKPHVIEFNVDFYRWPPPEEAISGLQQRYGNLKLFEPGGIDGMQEGYISLTTRARLSYQFVIDTQKEISRIVSQYGGYCNSWGIL